MVLDLGFCEILCSLTAAAAAPPTRILLREFIFGLLKIQYLEECLVSVVHREFGQDDFEHVVYHRSCQLLEKTLGGRSKILRSFSRRRPSMRNQAPCSCRFPERDLVDQIIAILLLAQLPIFRLPLKLPLPTVGQKELPFLTARRSNGERLHFVEAGLQSSDLVV